MLLDPLVRAANVALNVAAESSSLGLQCKDIDHCRTLQSIVYSCISTVFLCTWTALHLNVPRDPAKTSPLRRVWYMLGALLGPEVVFGFAFGDWSDGSEMLRKILDLSPTCGWTETHVQFAMMGGFRLKYADGETELMREGKLYECVKDGTIDLPNISKAEILERSKGDPIAKTITVIQTAWFVIQCIHRRSQDLPLTQLEITTLGHTLINFFVYWFWWYKPLGISFPIDVPSKKPPPEKKYLTTEGLDDRKGLERSPSGGSNDIVAHFLDTDNSNQEGEKSDALNDVLSFMSQQDEANLAPTITRTTEIEEQLTVLPSSNEDHGKAPEIFIPRSSNDNIITEPIINEHKVDLEGASVAPPRLSIYTRLGVKTYTDSDDLSLLGKIVLSVVFFIIGGAFGAIHCLAWSSVFPTPAEQYTWQVSSVIVTVIGGSAMVMAVNDSDDINYEKGPNPWIATFVVLVYSSARISLLILALLQLRALTYADYVTPSWSTFYPHIN